MEGNVSRRHTALLASVKVSARSTPTWFTRRAARALLRMTDTMEIAGGMSVATRKGGGGMAGARGKAKGRGLGRWGRG